MSPTFVVPPTPAVFLNNGSVEVRVTRVEELGVAEAVWHIRTSELGHFLKEA